MLIQQDNSDILHVAVGLLTGGWRCLKPFSHWLLGTREGGGRDKAFVLIGRISLWFLLAPPPCQHSGMGGGAHF